MDSAYELKALMFAFKMALHDAKTNGKIYTKMYIFNVSLLRMT